MLDTINAIIRYTGIVVIVGLIAVVGLSVFITLANAIVAFASTGVGAIVLIVIGVKLYSEYNKRK